MRSTSRTSSPLTKAMKVVDYGTVRRFTQVPTQLGEAIHIRGPEYIGKNTNQNRRPRTYAWEVETLMNTTSAHSVRTSAQKQDSGSVKRRVRKGSIQVFYDRTNQRFILSSSAQIRPIQEALVWHDESVSKDRIMVDGKRITVNGENLQVILPIAPKSVVAKCGKIVVRGRIWKIHLKLVEGKTNLKGASQTQVEEMPGRTLREGVGGGSEKENYGEGGEKVCKKAEA